MGQAGQDQVPGQEMAAFPPPEEPDWYAGDTLDAAEAARETAGEAAWKPLIPATRPARARLKAPRSRMVAGPMH